MIISLIIVRRNNFYRTYFGVPGSGKSTLATYYAMQVFKRNKKAKNKRKVYTVNLSVNGAILLNKEDININNEDLKHCLLLIDESGLDWNNRNYNKNFTQDQLKLFKYHRKLDIDIVLFSQTYDDMDKKLRDLSTQLYFIKKSMIPFFIKTIEIKKSIIIDKETKQIVEGYNKLLFSGFYVFMPKTWKFFDTEEKH